MEEANIDGFIVKAFRAFEAKGQEKTMRNDVYKATTDL